MKVKDLVESIVRTLVREPDAVSIRSLLGERAVLIEIKVAPADTPIVIGREGHTIAAIRHLARVVAAQERRQVEVAVLDGGKGSDIGRRPA